MKRRRNTKGEGHLRSTWKTAIVVRRLLWVSLWPSLSHSPSLVIAFISFNLNKFKYICALLARNGCVGRTNTTLKQRCVIAPRQCLYVKINLINIPLMSFQWKAAVSLWILDCAFVAFLSLSPSPFRCNGFLFSIYRYIFKDIPPFPTSLCPSCPRPCPSCTSSLCKSFSLLFTIFI